MALDTCRQLCVAPEAKGNLAADAFLAALAIESGCELITSDRGFGGFPGHRWRHPLGAAPSYSRIAVPSRASKCRFMARAAWRPA